MKIIGIACLLATAACGPAFTYATGDGGEPSTTAHDVGLSGDDGGILTADGAMRPDVDPPSDDAVDPPAVDGEADKNDAEADAGLARDTGTVGQSHDAMTSTDADDPDTYVAPPPPPRCDGPQGPLACSQWASMQGACNAAGEAMCCRTDGICGCKVNVMAACQ